MLRSRSTCGVKSPRILYFVAPNPARCLWRANSTLQAAPRRRQPLRVSNQSVLVKTWNYTESMADAFAIIRGLEDKYGPIREYCFMRDTEIATLYQINVFAVFVSPDSVRDIPPGGEVVRIPAPKVPLTRPGGLGLDDLSGTIPPLHLNPNAIRPVNESRGIGPMSKLIGDEPQFDDAPEEKIDGRVLEFKVERSHNEAFRTSGYPWATARKPYSHLGQYMLTWAGFAPLKPLPPDINLKDPELDMHPIHGIWMQRSLYKFTNLTGMTPSQLAPPPPPPPSPVAAADIPDAAPVSSPPPPRRAEIEWKPLPGTDPEILRDPAPMPGSVPEAPKPLPVSSTTPPAASTTPHSEPKQTSHRTAPTTPRSEQKQTSVGTAPAKQINAQSQQPKQTQKSGAQTPPPAQPKSQVQGQPKQKQKGSVQAQTQAQAQAQKQQPKPKPKPQTQTQAQNPNQNTNPNQKHKQKPKQTPKATPSKPDKVEAPTSIASKLKGLIGGWW